jgi:hypothetical protein
MVVLLVMQALSGGSLVRWLGCQRKQHPFKFSIIIDQAVQIAFAGTPTIARGNQELARKPRIARTRFLKACARIHLLLRARNQSCADEILRPLSEPGARTLAEHDFVGWRKVLTFALARLPERQPWPEILAARRLFQ